MTDSTKRSPREAETRAKTQRRKPWAPPSKLEAPEPPAGYKHRWIRTSLRGEDDQMNVTTKMREGWEPRPMSTVKSKLFPTINHGKWEGCIGVEGMMLCEMPIDKHRAMKAYYNNKSVEQNESLAGDLDSLGQKTGQPIYQERKSSVSGGRQVSVMED